MIKLTNREAVGFAVEVLTQVYENYEGEAKDGCCCICGKKYKAGECVGADCNNNDFVAAIDKLQRLRERKKL